jgi:hypothetical protein
MLFNATQVLTDALSFHLRTKFPYYGDMHGSLGKSFRCTAQLYRTSLRRLPGIQSQVYSSDFDHKKY